MTATAPEGRSHARLGSWLAFFALMGWMAAEQIPGCARSELVGRPAPDFEAQIVGGDGAGDRVSSASLRGRPVLLEFWASWCAPCRQSIPIVSRVAVRHAAELTAYGVDVEADRPAEWVRRAHAAVGMGFPTLHDATLAIQSAFGVRTIPTLVLIDAAGRVRHVGSGVPDESALEAEVRGIVEERR